MLHDTNTHGLMANFAYARDKSTEANQWIYLYKNTCPYIVRRCRSQLK